MKSPQFLICKESYKSLMELQQHWVLFIRVHACILHLLIPHTATYYCLCSQGHWDFCIQEKWPSFMLLTFNFNFWIFFFFWSRPQHVKVSAQVSNPHHSNVRSLTLMPQGNTYFWIFQCLKIFDNLLLLLWKFFCFFSDLSVACGSSQVRDRTWATAVAQAITVTMPNL